MKQENKAQLTLDLLVTRASDWYYFNEEVRKYHHIRHAYHVVRGVWELCGVLSMTEPPSPALLLAALWHDAVYVPGAGSDANERCSSAALKSTFREYTGRLKLSTKEFKVECPDLNVSGKMSMDKLAEIVDEACRLIDRTTVSIHLTQERIYGTLANLLDADLSSLASRYPRFVMQQHNIIEENGGNVKQHSKESAKFLMQFITCRKHIYHTDIGRLKWEDLARDNIIKYAKENYAN